MDKLFKVVYEIEIMAENPLEATKIALKWIKDEESESLQFYVQETNETIDEETGLEVSMPLYSVDLLESDEDAVFQVKGYEPLISAM